MTAGRVQPLAVAALIWALGWWTAGSASAASLDNLASLAAGGLAVHAWLQRRKDEPGPRQIVMAVALLVGCAGAALGWVWPAAVALALVFGSRTLGGMKTASLAFLAVPWIASDATVVGWFFRMTGAGAAGGVFDGLGFVVERSGTFLRIEDQQVAVDAACAGMDTLQATLVAGAWVALGVGRRGGWRALMALLPVLAWLANTLRIVVMAAVALSFGSDAAAGWFHDWGGVAVVALVFAAACGLAAWLGKEGGGAGA